jgi:nicotinamidase-related amidase
MLTRRHWFAIAAAAASAQAASQPATLKVRLRSRKQGVAVEDDALWAAPQTAIIICDMWNGHYCQNSVKRIEVIVPKMNAMLNKARDLGVQIVHSPSGCMDKYEGTPQRRRARSAKPVTPPFPLAKWCYLDIKDEPPLPIDDAASPCDDEVVGPAVRRFDRQHPGLEIKEPDAISDSGDEIFSFFEQQGIRNIVMMGVHTNMCVLGRPFGIRQLKRLGKNVTLARDMTDAMYDPREAPFVSHARGTELVIEHIERYWCPSLLSKDLTIASQGRTS